MNRHSITFPPAPQHPRADHPGLVLVAALIAASIGIGVLVALLLVPSSPQVQPREAHLADIRREAFRAGYLTATQGCGKPLALGMPLGVHTP